MEILQLIFTGGIAISIVSLIFSLYFTVSFFIQGKKIKGLKKSKGKRKLKKRLSILQQARKKTFLKLISFFILTGLAGGGSWYVNYYQSTNLSTEDMTNITDGFYYLRDLKDEFEVIQTGESDNEKSQQTINFVVTSLAGYSIKKASTLNTVEGQTVLNRYYKAMSELGINISRNSTSIFTNPDVLAELLSDIEKVQSYQSKVLDFYKIDSSVLEAQK